MTVLKSFRTLTALQINLLEQSGQPGQPTMPGQPLIFGQTKTPPLTVTESTGLVDEKGETSGAAFNTRACTADDFSDTDLAAINARLALIGMAFIKVAQA